MPQPNQKPKFKIPAKGLSVSDFRWLVGNAVNGLGGIRPAARAWGLADHTALQGFLSSRHDWPRPALCRALGVEVSGVITGVPHA